jgi:transcription factor S
MEFCEKCGALIVMKDNKIVCASCGHKSDKKLKIKSSEKIEKKASVAVVKKEESIHPEVEMKCPKCKHHKAYFWTQQTRSSDESETKFYRCVECGHSWRVYR